MDLGLKGAGLIIIRSDFKGLSLVCVCVCVKSLFKCIILMHVTS